MSFISFALKMKKRVLKNHKTQLSNRVVIIAIFSDHDPDTDRMITIVNLDLDQNKKLRSVSISIMKFSVNLYRSRANYHWLKVLVLK